MKKPDCENCEIFERNSVDPTCYNIFKDCDTCDKMKKYQAYLKNKRMFTKGEPITTFDEFAKQEWVFMYGKPKHRGFTHSQTFRTIKILLERKAIHYAIKK